MFARTVPGFSGLVQVKNALSFLAGNAPNKPRWKPYQQLFSRILTEHSERFNSDVLHLLPPTPSKPSTAGGRLMPAARLVPVVTIPEGLGREAKQLANNWTRYSLHSIEPSKRKTRVATVGLGEELTGEPAKKSKIPLPVAKPDEKRQSKTQNLGPRYVCRRQGCDKRKRYELDDIKVCFATCTGSYF